jgi:hypothetical protein
MPNRSSNRSATAGDRRDAPDSARRTDRNVSAGSSSKWENAIHIGGAPGTIVTRRCTIDSAAVAGSNRWTSRIVAPTLSDRPSTTLSPKMWNSGSTP